MNPFQRQKEQLMRLLPRKQERQKAEKKPVNLEQLFAKCRKCSEQISKDVFSENLYVCSVCGYHHKISAYDRLHQLLDSGSFQELFARVVGVDPLKFPGYAAKLGAVTAETGLSEAVVCATGKIGGRKAVLAVLDSSFFMGSMGTALGEKVTRAVEYATKYKLPLIIFSASGGARMQEGIFSLFQMAKTSAALKRHANADLLYISVLTNPTTGGVTASFASLGDIILAEPQALIGFAGPRVIEQTIGQKLPEDFQSSEYLKEHGFVDSIVSRNRMRDTLSLLLSLHEGQASK